MKKGKTFQKGKHIYTRTGSIKEVRTITEQPKLQYEFSNDCDEIYADRFGFQIKDKKAKICFYKEIPELNGHKLKKVIGLDLKTARDFLTILKNDLSE